MPISIPKWPEFIHSLPEADLPMEGLRGWLLNGHDAQLLFLEALAEVNVSAHSHGAQWGMVVEGSMEFTMDGQTKTIRQGDSYSVPAGREHGALLHKGFRAIDVFADRDRYRVKE
ncbi:MAG: cupin domain-containing protein [bacterium]